MAEEKEDLELKEAEENILLEQIKYLNNEMIGIQKAFLGAISLPLGVYAIAIYYALQSKHQAMIFSVLPFLFSLSVFNILKYTIKMLGIDAYIRHLEGIINSSHKKNLFMWQTYLIHTNHYSIIGGGCQLPAFFALAAYIGVMFWKSVDSLGDLKPWLPRLFIVLLVVEVVMLLWAASGCLTQYYAVRYWCGKIGFHITEDNEGKRSEPNTRQMFILTWLKEKLKN